MDRQNISQDVTDRFPLYRANTNKHNFSCSLHEVCLLGKFKKFWHLCIWHVILKEMCTLRNNFLKLQTHIKRFMKNKKRRFKVSPHLCVPARTLGPCKNNVWKDAQNAQSSPWLSRLVKKTRTSSFMFSHIWNLHRCAQHSPPLML